VYLVGLEEAGLWCLLARGLAPEVARTVVDGAAFDTTNDDLFLQKLFVPGLRRAGDFRTAATLTAPQPLFLHHTEGVFQTDWMVDVYRAAGAESNLRIERGKATEEQIVNWLAEKG